MPAEPTPAQSTAHTRRCEAACVRVAKKLGFTAVGGGLKSIPLVAILTPLDRLEEAKALVRHARWDRAWRMDPSWRRHFDAAGIPIPGERAGILAVYGVPA